MSASKPSSTRKSYLRRKAGQKRWKTTKPMRLKDCKTQSIRFQRSFENVEKVSFPCKHTFDRSFKQFKPQSTARRKPSRSRLPRARTLGSESWHQRSTAPAIGVDFQTHRARLLREHESFRGRHVFAFEIIFRQLHCASTNQMTCLGSSLANVERDGLRVRQWSAAKNIRQRAVRRPKSFFRPR